MEILINGNSRFFRIYSTFVFLTNSFFLFQIHGWSILDHSFAMFIMGDIYVDAKTALDSVKSSTRNFFRFPMSVGEVDRILTTFVK